MFQPHFPLFSLQDTEEGEALVGRQAQQAAGELLLGDVF